MHISVRGSGALIGGAICTGLSLKLFYIPHQFLDGGMTGLAVVLGRTFAVQPVYVLLGLNLVCLSVAARNLGEPFLWRTAAALVTLAAVLKLVGPQPPIWNPWAAAAAGGAGVGFGTGLVLREGAAIDGSEVLAWLLHARSGVSVVHFLIGFNALLFTTICWRYGLHAAGYSLLAQCTNIAVVAAIMLRMHTSG